MVSRLLGARPPRRLLLSPLRWPHHENLISNAFAARRGEAVGKGAPSWSWSWSWRWTRPGRAGLRTCQGGAGIQGWRQDSEGGDSPGPKQNSGQKETLGEGTGSGDGDRSPKARTELRGRVHLAGGDTGGARIQPVRTPLNERNRSRGAGTELKAQTFQGHGARTPSRERATEVATGIGVDITVRNEIQREEWNSGREGTGRGTGRAAK